MNAERERRECPKERGSGGGAFFCGALEGASVQTRTKKRTGAEGVRNEAST